MPDISVIIPAFNEELRILPTLQSIHTFFSTKNLTVEVLVINDGSSDKTAEVVEKAQHTIPYLKLHTLESNKGKGYAVKTGMRISSGASILFMDADSSTPISELEKFLPYAQDFDVIIGSRHLDITSVQQKAPLYRRFITLVARTFFLPTLVKGIEDTQCGFKLFKHDIAKKLAEEQTIEGFAFDIELILHAQKHGYTIKEIPVLWKHVERSRFHPIFDTLKTTWEVFKIALDRQA